MNTFKDYFNKLTGNDRKKGGILNVGPKPGSKHQNIVRKQDKLDTREHPEIAAFNKFNASKRDITPKVHEIVKIYNITLPEEGEERYINSNSGIKITNHKGRYYLEK